LIELLAEYGMLVVKPATALILLFSLAGVLLFMIRRTRSGTERHLAVRHLNQKYEKMQLMRSWFGLREAVVPSMEMALPLHI
jgi:hypothetical protein